MAETTVRRRKRTTTKTQTPVKKAPQRSLKDRAKPPGQNRAGKIGHGVIFGPPKTGKTGAACGPNTLLISFDPDGDSTEILAGREDVYVLQPRTFEEAEEIVASLHAGQAKDFDYIVFDSLTYAFQLFDDKNILKIYQKGGDIRRGYGRAGSMVVSLVHDLTQLRETSVIFTAHLAKDDEKGDDGLVSVDTELGESEVKLAVTEMVWKVLGGAVSWIGRTYKDEVREKQEGSKKLVRRSRYMLSFNDGERSPAGSRYTMAGQYEINRDSSVLQQIEADINGGA
jgi:hypothetical protein